MRSLPLTIRSTCVVAPVSKFVTPFEVIVAVPPGSLIAIDVAMAADLNCSEFVRADATASDDVELSRTAKNAARPVPMVMMPSKAKGTKRRPLRILGVADITGAVTGALSVYERPQRSAQCELVVLTAVDVDCAVGHAPCLTAADNSGYQIDEAEVIYWGTCPKCLAIKRRKSRNSAGD